LYFVQLLKGARRCGLSSRQPNSSPTSSADHEYPFVWPSLSIVAASGLMVLSSCGGSTNGVNTHSAAPASPETAAPAFGQLGSQSQLLERAAQADSFVDSVGVVTHLTYNNTPYYTAWPGVLSALETLGVRHIRDGFYDWAASSPYIAEHQALAEAGIKCTYVVPIDSATTPPVIEQFAPEVSDLEALEAPDECDALNNCGGGGATGIANMLAFLPTIDAAGKDLGVSVLGPSFTQQSSYVMAGNLSAEMTFNNLHVYFGGRNPGTDGWGADDPQGHAYGSFDWWLDQANLDAPGVPSQITETGYIAYPSTSTPYTLPESVEASYIPRTLLLAFIHGIRRTFLYELLDEISSPGYGLLSSDLTPKPAFTAVKNLLSVLSDPGSSFSPGALSYSVTGADSSLHHVLLQKRDGSFWLVLWLEQSSFDPVAAAPIAVSPENITLRLNSTGSAKQVLQFNDIGNMVSTDVTAGGSTLPLTVSDQLTIVQIVPQCRELKSGCALPHAAGDKP
jgi:hypothetical protein